jgi:hypothetical protein
MIGSEKMTFSPVLVARCSSRMRSAHVAVEVKAELLVGDDVPVIRLGNDGLEIEMKRRLSGRRRKRTKMRIAFLLDMDRVRAGRRRPRAAENVTVASLDHGHALLPFPACSEISGSVRRRNIRLIQI